MTERLSLSSRGEPEIILFNQSLASVFPFFFFNLIFIFGCAGSSLLLCGFILVALSEGCSSLQYLGCSLEWLLLLRSTGSRVSGLQQLQLAGSKVQAQ